MFLAIKKEQYEKHNVLFSEKIENKIINNSDFYRILYSDENSIMNGVNILFKLSQVTIERYFNKIKCNFTNSTNNAAIQFLKDIENSILVKFNTSNKRKKAIHNIEQQLNNNYIKIFTNKYISYGKKSELCLLLKISGIWESETEYGITFRFFIINHLL
tara:strand:- start:187 stop:663 length:477 start_codon:yes stop_codon:yes gene_type:complete